MIDLLSYQFFLGIIIGGLLVSAIYPIIFKKKRDLSTLEENLNDIKKTMNDLQDKNSSYQGKITEKLESFTLSGMNFEKIANEMKNTLVAGSSQKQGAWGEMVLSHILNKLQFTEGEEFQFTVPQNCWFAAHLINKNGYALVGCTVAPGFEFADFFLADKKQLSEQYPQFLSLIADFCT